MIFTNRGKTFIILPFKYIKGSTAPGSLRQVFDDVAYCAPLREDREWSYRVKA